MIISLLISVCVFYSVSILMLKLNTEIYLKRLTENKTSQESWEKASIIITAHVTSAILTTILGRILWKKLPRKTRYRVYIGARIVWVWCLNAYDSLKDSATKCYDKTLGKFARLRRQPRSDNCLACEQGDLDYKKAVAQTEIINFCINIPKDSEKMALAAAIKVVQKLSDKVRNYNRVLDELEAEGEDVSADRLDDVPGALENPLGMQIYRVFIPLQHPPSTSKLSGLITYHNGGISSWGL